MLRDAYIGEDKVSRIYTGEHLVHPLPVQDGLVLWYDFMGRKNSDAKRSIAEDLSGNGNHGTLMNFAYQPGSGYAGDGLIQDGVDDYILGSPSSSEAPFDNGVTVEVCLEPSKDYPGDDNLKYRGIVSKRNSGSTNQGSFAIDWTGSGEQRMLRFLTSGNPHRTLSISDFVFDGTTHLIFSASKDYLSIHEKSVLLERRDSFGEIQNTLDPIDVGRVFGGVSYAFEGSLFSVRVYNRALTPEEIQHNYQLEKERWNL